MTGRRGRTHAATIRVIVKRILRRYGRRELAVAGGCRGGVGSSATVARRTTSRLGQTHTKTMRRLCDASVDAIPDAAEEKGYRGECYRRRSATRLRPFRRATIFWEFKRQLIRGFVIDESRTNATRWHSPSSAELCLYRRVAVVFSLDLQRTSRMCRIADTTPWRRTCARRRGIRTTPSYPGSHGTG